MSRSRRKVSIRGVAGDSEKEDKRLYNRRYRRAFKLHLICRGKDDAWPHIYEHSDPWGMSKDGKGWFDARKYPKLMRK